MNLNKVALLGCSGHSYVVADALISSGYELIGYYNKVIDTNFRLNLPYLGFEKNSDFIKNVKDTLLFPAIGDNLKRRNVLEYLLFNKLSVIQAIHYKSNIALNCEIENGTLVCQGANINSFSKIGKGVIINTSSIIEHECIINNYVHIAPGAVLAGNVTIGENSFVGANAVIKQGIKIGENVIIGAGAVVVKNVPDNITLVGNPAIPLIK